MTVRNVLSTKGETGIVTIAPDATVREAAELLSQKRIGTVVASSDGKTCEGILSERDIVREIGARGAEVLNERVEAIMTREIQTCARSDTAKSVLQRMTEGRFRHMPVVEGGEMVGLVSLGDIVKDRLTEVRAERDALTDMVMGHG